MPSITLRKSHVGKIVHGVLLPGATRGRIRWITSENNGRYYARTPKIGVLLRKLHLQRNADFGPEKILPIGTKVMARR